MEEDVMNKYYEFIKLLSYSIGLIILGIIVLIVYDFPRYIIYLLKHKR